MNMNVQKLKELQEAFVAASNSIGEADLLESRLKTEAAEHRAHLAGLGLNILGATSEAGDHFDAGNQREVRALADCETKLSLLPAVRARQLADLEAMKLQVRRGVKELMAACSAEAEKALAAKRGEAAEFLVKIVRGGPDLLKQAVCIVEPFTDSKQWSLCLNQFRLSQDVIRDVENAIALAESFSRGEPCPDIVLPDVLTMGLQAAAAARAMP
jgi:hypothetical protein